MRLILFILCFIPVAGSSQMKYEFTANPQPVILTPFYTDFNSTGIKSYKRYRDYELIGEYHYDKKGRRTLQVSHNENKSYSYTETSYSSAFVIKHKMGSSRDSSNYTLLTETYTKENKHLSSEYFTYRKNKIAYKQSRNWEYLNGNLITWEYKNQSIQKYFYKENNLIKCTHRSNGSTMYFEKKFTYNKANLPIVIEEYFNNDTLMNPERKYVYKYNDLNQVVSDTFFSFSKPDEIQVSNYEYYKNGKLKTMQVAYKQDSLRLDITYDKFNNTTKHKVTTTTLNCAYLKYWYYFGYTVQLDSSGKLEFEKNFTYDEKGNLLGVKTVSNNHVLSNFTFKIEYY